MGFIIRNDEDLDSNKKYFNYLKRKKGGIHPTLWEYFSQDFFHDGSINSIEQPLNINDITFSITCPNIKHLTRNDFEFVNVDFKCKFNNIKSLDIKYLHEDNDIFAIYSYPVFIRSEINTLCDDISDKSLNSIIMNFDHGNYSTFWSIIFESINVDAVEEVAFSLILNSCDYIIPLPSKNQNHPPKKN